MENMLEDLEHEKILECAYVYVLPSHFVVSVNHTCLIILHSERKKGIKLRNYVLLRYKQFLWFYEIEFG